MHRLTDVKIVAQILKKNISNCTVYGFNLNHKFTHALYFEGHDRKYFVVFYA